MKRRELFSSLASPFSKKNVKQESIIRPPYFKNENKFLKKCVDCEDKQCADACEEQIIVIQDDGTPKLKFNKNGCTFCDECAIVCEKNVLKIKHKKNINATFSIDLIKCMSWHDTMCFSCKDPCLVDAIKFLGMFRPEIDMDVCNGCGFCISVCPTNAISFKVKEEK